MKKVASLGIMVLVLASLTAPVFALDSGFDRRHYQPTRHVEQRWHERGRPAYRQTYNRYTPYRHPGVVVNLPIVPLPGVSHRFPSINVRLY